MTRRMLVLSGLWVLAAGCSRGVEGTWLGKVDCDAFSWNLRIDLEREDRLTFEGAAVQSRTFTNSAGFDASTTVDLDVSAILQEPSGVQDLASTFVCTSNVTVADRPDGSQETTEGCDQSRYEDYALRWDGEDRMRLTSGRQNCDGRLERRG